MLVDDIVRLVREYLDEVDALSDISQLSGGSPVNKRIMSLIPECAVMFARGEDMPAETLATFQVDASGVATMDIPDDWGRLSELKLSCWHRSVFSAIDADSPQYRRQQSFVTRGGTRRPVVAIVPYGSGRRLEMYSVPAWDSRVGIERATYVPIREVASGDTLNISESDKSVLCYMVAVRVARSYGMAGAVEALSVSLQEEINKNNIIR